MKKLPVPKIASKIATKLRERKRLRSATHFHFAIADRFRLLNREDWLAVTAGQSFFFTPDYLEMIEAAGPETLEPRYALICDDEGPVAAVCMQVVRVAMTQLGDPAKVESNGKLKEKITQRLLVCGNLLTYGMHAVCFAPGADPDTVWPGVAEVLYRVRRAEKIAGQTNIIVVKDVPVAQFESMQALKGLSYAAVETEPNMVLTTDPAWKSYADYLASLTSKYRSSVKQQIMKPFDEAGCELVELTSAEAVAPYAETLQQLYLQVQGNAALRPFTLTADYWPALAEAAGPRLVVHLAKQQERVIGFIATLHDGDTAFAYHIGFDREVAQSGVPIYLRLLHASLAQAIEFGAGRISFGRTALEPKARLGCQPEPMGVWVRHRQPMLNQFIRPMLQFIQHDEAPEFSPFKKAKAVDEAASA